ncbi:hypothetical protein Pla175_00520 [Pirellulimonas nuda]|uniref:PEP-CTERM protein-sorting domain-containing protein n=1 Tax=Pirellulimonas nuda TaxID=2528009 RepID=A0A518D5F7_9BACT|nr:hypothetical protein [Pirellulimonas nuda]QDU86702.1 hypothetical protein Pla175_00520 [Pirellulimonas nuda]
MNARQAARLLLPFSGSALALGLLLPAELWAGDYYHPVPFLATVKLGGEGATPVDTVYGKEYSHNDPGKVLVGGGDPNLVSIDDHDEFGVADPLQVVSWDYREGRIPPGNSGSVNAFDFGSVSAFNYPDGQIDALANSGDFLFRQVLRNESTLLFSVTGDSFGGAPKGRVHYEDPVGLGAVWAEPELPLGPGAGVNHHRVAELDALEVWGPEPPEHDLLVGPPKVVIEGYIGGFGFGPNTADSNRFSIDNDALNGGVSVWAYDITTAAITPWIPHSEIVTAVEKLFLPAGFRFDDLTRDQIDVDATMAYDIGGDPAIPGAFPGYNVGDELLFSIDPLVTPRLIDPSGAPAPYVGPPIHGGEIIHLAKIAAGVGPATVSASFLFHGGHLWDSIFNPALAFGYDSPDVDALESVGTLTGTFEIPTIPEPSSLLLCAFVAPLLALRRSR